MLQLAVLALATYPVAFGQMTRLVTGLAPGDPKFQRKYYEFLRALGARLLTGDARVSAKASAKVSKKPARRG
jgi:tRNA U55 pseudouridine synthase TruB